jgi:hypothetical protein
MAYVTPEQMHCPNCNKSGLAILPVRYAVVPTIADARLPPSLGNKVTDVVLKHHKYALRTLRKGYLYLFYEKHARGRHIKWEVYSVAEGGTLWKQVSIDSVAEITDVRCSRKEHLIPASVITIDTPNKCGRVWMAFSEHRWSEKTFSDFEQNVALRDRRMQTFNPALWIEKRGYRHGLEATEANLNEVVEYRTGFVLSALGGTGVKTISQPDGSFDKKVLNHCSTVHPLTVRRDDKSKLVGMMKKAGERADGNPHAPIIIALWDSVGITHELNGFRNDAAGWAKKYSVEREREIGAAVSIEGAKKALQGRAQAHVQSIADFGVFQWSAAQTQARLQTYGLGNTGTSVGRARQLDLCARWERDAAVRAPAHLASRRSMSADLSENQWRSNMASIDADIAVANTPDSATGTSRIQHRDTRSKDWERDAVVQAWPKYEALIDRRELDSFIKAYNGFLSTAARIIDERTEDVVEWLKSNALQDALTEFHRSVLDDGVAFESIVGTLIMGITSSPAGYTYIIQLIEEAKCSENNLIWRAIAFNQAEESAELNSSLDEIKKSNEESFSEKSLEAAKESTKYFAKLGQMVSKALSLHNALRKKDVKTFNTGGIEKILLTVGGIFIKPFVKNGADKLSGWLIRGLIMVRCGSEYNKVIDLLMTEAKFGRMDRADTLFLLNSGREAASQNRLSGRRLLNEKWEALVKDAETPKENVDRKLSGGFNEARELRFSVVAAILQLVYIGTLLNDLADNSENKKLRSELWIAGMSLGAGLADIGALCVKVVHAVEDSALSYQGLKLAGGFLSAGAAWLNFQKDMSAKHSKDEAGQYIVGLLYQAKGWGNLFVGAASAINSLSYTQPAFEMIARKFPSTALGRGAAALPRAAGRLAKRLLIRRAFLICGGLYANLAMLGIELILWKFSDDELQKWCKNSAFGKEKSERNLNAANQALHFEAALKEVVG